MYYEDQDRNRPKPELQEAWNRLRQKIAKVMPKVIIPLGDEPMRAITENRGIEDWQGSILNMGINLFVVPTFHPSSILRGGGRSHWYYPTAMKNLKRAKLVAEGKIKPSTVPYESLNGAKLKALYNKWMEKTPVEISFDIETKQEGGEAITCIGFSDASRKGYVVNFLEERDIIEHTQIMGLIGIILRSGAIQKIGQNAYNFDIPMIHKLWEIRVQGFVWDTMIAHMALHPELPHDLGYLTSQYTTIPYYKHLSETDLIRYNAMDAVATFEVKKRQEEEMKRRGLLNRYHTYWHKMLYPMQGMFVRGMQIDTEYQKKLKGELTNEIKALQCRLDEEFRKHTNSNVLKRRLQRLQQLEAGGRKTINLYDRKTSTRKRRRVVSQVKAVKEKIKKLETLNVRSSTQLPHFLYNVLKLPKKTYRGKVTTNEKALNQLYIKTQHEFLKTIIELRKLEHRMSNYAKMSTDEKGRARSTYKLLETGRLSSGKFEAK